MFVCGYEREQRMDILTRREYPSDLDVPDCCIQVRWMTRLVSCPERPDRAGEVVRD